MAGFALKVGLFGERRVIDKLTGISRRASNVGVLLKKLAILGFIDVQDHFRNTMGPSGKWKPLAPSTIARRKGGSSVPLQDTGALRNSLTPESGQTSEGRNRIILFTRTEYAGKHEFGKGVPQRRFMWVSQFMKDRMRKTAESHVVKG